MDYPLEGLKVLDFSRVLAGPFAGRMLCDLGADVVKVEPPDGDVTRLWGRVIANVPGYFHQQNVGKRNISIDLRAPGATDLVGELVARADILIENYRPDVMGRLGIGYEALSRINPRLIQLSISGFGQNGPESRRPAYAPVVHAEAGLIHRAARRGSTPFLDLPLSVADTNASLHGLVALLAAVIMRARTGRGQHIDIAMIDATIATDDQLQFEMESSEDSGPLRNEVWKTPIGPILVSTDVRHLWKLLTRRCGVPEVATEGMSLEEKIAKRHAAITAFFMTFDTREALIATMDKLNLAWGDVRAGTHVRDQPTLKARRSIVDVDDRDGGTRPTTQSPYRFSAASSGVRGVTAHRGEHNAQVLADWLAKSDEDVAALLGAGVLSRAEPH